MSDPNSDQNPAEWGHHCFSSKETKDMRYIYSCWVTEFGCHLRPSEIESGHGSSLTRKRPEYPETVLGALYRCVSAKISLAHLASAPVILGSNFNFLSVITSLYVTRFTKTKCLS